MALLATTRLTLPAPAPHPLVAPVAAAALAVVLAAVLARLAPLVIQTTATVRASPAPAASVATGPNALMALLATTRPTLPAPARHLVAPVAALAPAVLLEAPTTALAKTLLALAVSVPDTLSAQMGTLATTLPTQPPLALTVPLELVQELVQERAALALAVPDLA